MITYAYWAIVIALAGAVLFGVGMKLKKWTPALAITGIILVIGWGAYVFHYQQIFVKRYGGVMSISVPDGQFHMGLPGKTIICGFKIMIRKPIPVSSVNIPGAICWKAKSSSGIATR
jgi:hypothetical protein